MRVSVAMATYDGAAWVEEQLESIAAQTRLPDELVVCDDRSHDDTPERVAAFAARAPFPVRLERNATNLTSTPNFEKALGLCDADIVFFADQDDVWHPEKIETLAGLLEAHPAVGMVFSDGRVVDAERNSLGHGLWEALWFDAREQAMVRAGRAAEVFARHVVAAGTTLAFRARRFRDLVLPFPPLRDCHDSWVAFLIAAVAEVRIVERPLIDYRVHGANQFGLHKPSFREQVQAARGQLDVDAFRYGVELFGAARERLLAQARPDAEVLGLIDAKVAHCERREAMAVGIRERLPLVLAECLNGRYRRFSYGWKSVAQDLLLR